MMTQIIDIQNHLSLSISVLSFIKHLQSYAFKFVHFLCIYGGFTFIIILANAIIPVVNQHASYQLNSNLFLNK
ncbi:hypothetical protein FGO68_gene8300 [Halteria grandinella]|uniref:Uncharacterized protein n=1 Tax=Halteria grandinella TaxID=5974 RepID=A0A8J8NBP6_HALGN|nr:hypothetical protein FGO68_gene8300 [Halteria grandinella]